MKDNEPIHLASAIVLSHVDKVESVKGRLASMEGIEVHNESNDGRIIITVESPKYRDVADLLLSIKDIEGVLSSELVYQYSDGDKVSDGDKAH
ncbi:MAG: chaperone NapD [Magnetococcales bacterium]|nr:chaperone NapD [Magnetococcales bacterium]